MKKLYLLTLLIGSFASAQIINFPDPVFKAKLLAASPSNTIASAGFFNVKIDTDNDGQISQAEAAVIEGLDVSASGITDMTGIAYFSNLHSIKCQQNALTSLDLSALIHLDTRIDCSNNQLTSLVLPTVVVALGSSLWFNCANNLLTDLNFNTYADFFDIDLSNNQFSDFSFLPGYLITMTMNLSNNPATSFHYVVEPLSDINSLTFFSNTLVDFYIDTSQCGLHSLNVEGDNLTNVTCHVYAGDYLFDTLLKGPLTSLDLHGDFGILSIMESTAESLDFSQCTYNTLSLIDTDAVYVNAKNGDVSSHLGVFGQGNENPNLQYICVDEGEIATLQSEAITWASDIVINSYCSFDPGGEFYTAEGNVRFDLDANGCDASDMAFPYIRFDITDGQNIGGIITNNLGHYQIPVQAATHTVTPHLENPIYFNVSPPSISVTFPAAASPHQQDFCVTANGIHADIEVALVPIGAARPGFDSYYKLIYKNKGNVALLGTVSFSYGNTVEFVSAEPNITSQSAQVLNWYFTDLQPFEQREIIIVMNVNSPMETPAVNADDVLYYYASGITDTTDGTPYDNHMLFSQTVVNSLDPNDKTCLEGNTIDPNMVGKYVHYQIRFENTGTANAQNIVVKDVIDTDKFNIDSLVPMDASHDFYTRIKDNKVEFIFENIQLPFDDANNDGYVMFKIKTKPTLVAGDSFSNSASIYFDYNHPIVTDPAVTTIQLLTAKDFEFSQEFTLYPNPAHDVLNIQSKKNTKIHSIDIYNTLGQLVLAPTNAEIVSKIDVSDLASGNYFVKVTSSKGNSNAKFIKR